MERNDACWCGSGKKYKKCHMFIDEKIALLEEQGHIVPTRDILKTPEQIEGIKKSAELNTAVLDHVAKHICAGMSPLKLINLYMITQPNTVESLHLLAMTVSQKVFVHR